MKELSKRLLSLMLLVCMVITMIPAKPAEAISDQNIKSVTISSKKFKKISKSSSSNSFIDSCSSGKYTAIVKGTLAEDAWDLDHMKKLYVTDGKTEDAVNLEKIVKEKFDLASDKEIRFYQLTCIKSKFYITGAYGEEFDFVTGDAKCFLISTKTGSSVTVKAIKKNLITEWPCSALQGWGLYYMKDLYVATPFCNSGEYNSSTEDYTYKYFTSSDLSSWTTRKVKASSYTTKLNKGRGGNIHMHLGNVSDKAFYYNETITSGPRGDFKYADSVHVMYTSDHENFKAVTSLNDCVDTNKNKRDYDEEIFEDYTRFLHSGKFGGSYNCAIMDRQHSSEDGYYNAMNQTLFTATKVNNFVPAVKFNDSYDYSYYIGLDESKYANLYLKKGSKKYFYRINGEKGTSTKYATSLDSEKIGDGCGKGSYSYIVYNGKYLLVSKNGGKTVYKINTGKTKLQKATIAGDYLVLAGSKGYDYRILLSTVNNACK